MNTAEQIALVTDYIRSKDDMAGYINDVIGIDNVGRSHSERRKEAEFFCATAEAMQFDQLGEWLVDKLVCAYFDKAIEWKWNQTKKHVSTIERDSSAMGKKYE
jgi:hypothetical protein